MTPEEKAEEQLGRAEQQLFGFANHADGVSTLAENMGLTRDEWEEIKRQGLNPLNSDDTDELDDLFG